ncbi:fused MFS transporter/spermidine synthase family protein [Micromonospora craniellae]|uniref:Uncharacterized protein n=1 Tax=Micromonospora craniellae TaxID=2294034 RepID=A0A372G616_9ACTN|nr:hypothetical protein [Micromonospora craniellae]QOC90135.1 hypothetical protein ID554_18225 [Micromonospora craniellae]RFS48477.1 hypothetical protein D0Q02_03120 [Micromonospora craniellae]
MAPQPELGRPVRVEHEPARPEPVPHGPEQEKTLAIWQSARAFGLVAFPATALSFLLVAISFAGGRSDAGWATGAYWSGQLLLIAVTGAACLHPRLTPALRVASLFAFTAAQYAIKVAYSPINFKFADELQHWQTTLGMLDSGRLFPTNYSLPISPVFPGLEILTVTVMHVTGLAFFPAAVVVCAASTMLLTAAVLALVRQVTPRWDIVALATLVYLTNPNHGFFTSMFLYTTAALPMLALAFTQVVSLLRDPRRPVGRVLLGLLFCGGVLVTHHLTMVVCVALLLTAVLCAAALRPLRRSLPAVGTLVALVCAMTTAWVAFVAPAAVSYLGGPLIALAETFTQLGGGPSGPSVASTKPMTETALSAAAILVLGGAAGLLGLWALRRRIWWLAVLLIGMAGLEAAIIIIRVVSPRGEELAGRAPAYVTLLVAVVLALGLQHLRVALTGARRIAAAGLALLVLFLGGLTAGWPPYWLRVPGTYHVAGYEASIEPHTLGLGWWARENLPAGSRFVADFGNQNVLGTIGGLDPVNSPAGIFYRPAFDWSDRSMVQALSVRYLVADRRLLDQPPVRGTFFIGDHPPGLDTSGPFPPEALAKFDTVEGMGVVFDDGMIRVYDLRNSRYAW